MKATKQEISDMINYLSRSTNAEPTEPLPEEEEESPYTDNTTNRDDIINAQPGDYDAWINGLNGLDISTPSIPSIDFSDENQIYQQIPLTIDATKLMYNTRNFRLEDLAAFGQKTHSEYKKEYERLTTLFAQQVSDENADYGCTFMGFSP